MPMIHGFTEGTLYIPKFLVTAGYPLLEKFDELLLSMQANGLIDKWDKDISSNQAHKYESQLTALSIGHMALSFVNLLIGFIISLIVFIVEIILKRRKDKKCVKIKSYSSAHMDGAGLATLRTQYAGSRQGGNGPRSSPPDGKKRLLHRE
ncbi:hypothetical protein CBL_08447 [Carabus blaptoides fortunei]